MTYDHWKSTEPDDGAERTLEPNEDDIAAACRDNIELELASVVALLYLNLAKD
jgi:hypothetical protein